MTAKTSESHPLEIQSVTAPGGGLIGMTFCPGKKQVSWMSGEWDRDLDVDLAAVRKWGAVAVVTLMEAHELPEYKVARLGDAVQALGMEWHHLPIIDGDVPRAPFEDLWVASGPRLRAHLGDGKRILLHCRGGLGRTGTIAARLLAELGMPPRQAIAAVRKARKGTIENSEQETHVLGIRPFAPRVGLVKADADACRPSSAHNRPRRHD